jgi:hypothetical protein
MIANPVVNLGLSPWFALIASCFSAVVASFLPSINPIRTTFEEMSSQFASGEAEARTRSGCMTPLRAQRASVDCAAWGYENMPASVRLKSRAIGLPNAWMPRMRARRSACRNSLHQAGTKPSVSR